MTMNKRKMTLNQTLFVSRSCFTISLQTFDFITFRSYGANTIRRIRCSCHPQRIISNYRIVSIYFLSFSFRVQFNDKMTRVHSVRWNRERREKCATCAALWMVQSMSAFRLNHTSLLFCFIFLDWRDVEIETFAIKSNK